MTDNEYSVQEAAERLGIPVGKLRRWDAEGVLVAVRTEGGHRRYLRELIDQIAGLGEEKPNASHELAKVKRSLDEKRHIIQLLVESETRYRDLIETTHDLIWATDARGSFTYVNSASQHIFGLAPNDMLGRCFFDFESDSSHISNRRFLSILRRTGEVKNYVTHLRTPAGEDRWIGINARVITSEAKEIRGLRGTIRDITEEQLALRRIEHMALHDTLTDLPNRHALTQDMEQVVVSGAPGALLIVDIDHFKSVNDNFGPRTGDQIVVGIGGVLRDLVHDHGGDLYRTGGDEFAIHLPQGLRKDAVHMAERVLAAVRHYRLPSAEGRVVSNISASIGIGLYPFHGDSQPALLSNADIALYQAKALGRNRYAFYEPSIGILRDTHQRTYWAQRFAQVLEHDDIVLFAQPVVRLADLRTTHHEILLRLRGDSGDSGDLIEPAHFLSIAESLGVIQELDLRVVEKVLEHIAREDLAQTPVRFFINLSVVSMSSPAWLDRLVDQIVRSNVAPNQLVFEIGEAAALADVNAAMIFIRRLKEMGCRVALDDFGSGFSSFYYLNQFDVDYLKIDGSFVRNLGTDHGARLFVKALNDVALGLKKQVIAEWVEDAATLEQLLRIGTQYGQGYHLHKPRPLEEFDFKDPALLTAAA